MWPRWLVPRYGIRTLLLAVAAVAVGLWAYLYLPGILRDRSDRLSRATIDPYELSIAGDGDPAKAPQELVAILGDSRLKHWGPVTQVDFGAAGTLVSWGGDERVCYWDAISGRRKRAIPATDVAVAPKGNLAFLAEVPGQILVWDIASDKPVRRLEVRSDADIGRIVSNDDGSIIAIVYVERTNARGFCVEAWKVGDSKKLREINVAQSESECLAINPRGTLVAFRDNRSMKVLSLVSESEAVVIEPPSSSRGEPDGFRIAEFFDDEHLLAALVGGRIIFWNATTGNEVDEIPHWGGSIDGLTTKQSQNEVAHCNSSRVSVLSGRVGKHDWHERIELLFRSGKDHVSDVAMSNKLLAAAHGDHTISLWDTWTPGRKARITGGEGIETTCLAFHPDGRQLFTASRRGEVTVWEVGSWRRLRSWAAHTTEVSYLTISPDGKTLATSGPDKTVILWDAATGAELRVHPDLMGAVPVAFSWDSAWYAIPGNHFDPSTILINEVQTGNPIATIRTAKSSRPMGLMPFSPDAATIMASVDKRISHFDIAKRSLIASFGMKQVDWDPLEAVWFSDGRRAATQGGRGEVVIWDLSTHAPLVALKENARIVKSIALSRDERWLATSGWNGKVCLWNSITGSLVKSWQLGPPKGIVRQVAFSPDGRYLATVNGNGTAYLLRLDWLNK